MSQMGQNQTWDCRSLMSPLPPKADIVWHGGNVRFVPEADISPKSPLIDEDYVPAPGMKQRICVLP